MMDSKGSVPSGASGIKSDFLHYCEVHGISSAAGRLFLPLQAPSFLALAVYRFGRWVQHDSTLPRRMLFPVRIAYAIMFEVVRHLTGILLYAWVEVEDRVWFASFSPIVVGAKRIGRGTMIHSGVTLGAGGSRLARGVPTLGANVIVGPGASVVGPVVVPDGTVIGPNTLLTHSPQFTCNWLGTPAMRSKRPAELLIPGEPAFVRAGR